MCGECNWPLGSFNPESLKEKYKDINEWIQEKDESIPYACVKCGFIVEFSRNAYICLDCAMQG